MIPLPATVPSTSVRRWLLLFPLLFTGCASTTNSALQEPVETVLSLPAQQIRQAVIEVLTEEGYHVETSSEAPPTVSTGYRREMDSPWDWLLRFRFGVGRTQAEARITELTETSSKLSIQVYHESKATFWNGWTTSDAPLAQQPDYYLRLIKDRLQLL